MIILILLIDVNRSAHFNYERKQLDNGRAACTHTNHLNSYLNVYRLRPFKILYVLISLIMLFLSFRLDNEEMDSWFVYRAGDYIIHIGDSGCMRREEMQVRKIFLIELC